MQAKNISTYLQLNLHIVVETNVTKSQTHAFVLLKKQVMSHALYLAGLGVNYTLLLPLPFLFKLKIMIKMSKSGKLEGEWLHENDAVAHGVLVLIYTSEQCDFEVPFDVPQYHFQTPFV